MRLYATILIILITLWIMFSMCFEAIGEWVLKIIKKIFGGM